MMKNFVLFLLALGAPNLGLAMNERPSISHQSENATYREEHITAENVSCLKVTIGAMIPKNYSVRPNIEFIIIPSSNNNKYLVNLDIPYLFQGKVELFEKEFHFSTENRKINLVLLIPLGLTIKSIQGCETYVPPEQF